MYVTCVHLHVATPNVQVGVAVVERGQHTPSSMVGPLGPHLPLPCRPSPRLRGVTPPPPIAVQAQCSERTLTREQ